MSHYCNFYKTILIVLAEGFPQQSVCTRSLKIITHFIIINNGLLWSKTRLWGSFSLTIRLIDFYLLKQKSANWKNTMICVISDVHNQMMSLFKEPKLVAVLCVQLFMAIKSNLIVNTSQALVWIDHVHRLLFGYIHQEATTKRPHI